MAWNPSPKVADCRYIARKWSKKQVIIIGIDDRGQMEMATYGETKTLCAVTQVFGDAAFNAIERVVRSAELELKENQ